MRLDPLTRLLAAALLIFATRAFSDGTSPPSTSSSAGADAPACCPLVTLRRAACFGTCPVYDLKVYRDGRVEYFGHRFVKACGARTASLTPAAVNALQSAFAEADYFAFSDEYTHMEVTDMPSAFTSYCDGTRTKSIRHYFGDSAAPDALTQLEARIDEIVGTRRWLLTSRDVPKGRALQLYLHDPCERRNKVSRP